MNKDILLRTLERWHEEDQFQKIIDTIYDLPEEELDYTLKSHLARALNNNDELEEAVRILLSIQDEGKNDPLWYFRLGYAYYYLDREREALPLFEQAYRLNPQDDMAKQFIDWCKESIAEDEPENIERYTSKEMEAIEKHIERYFGKTDNVFHELVSPDIHVDIYIVTPTPERNFYTLITGGMGAHKMNIPEDMADEGLEHAELLITLPPDWNIHGQDEKDYWPIRWLKILARLPITEDTWLGYGHTIETGEDEETVADNAPFQGIMLVTPQDVSPQADTCRLPGGKTVNFYQLIPLFKEEMKFKLDHDADELIERMADVDHVVDIHRKNTCADYLQPKPQKNFYLQKDEIYPLLTNWNEADGCIASDRILVDGCKVGYMYRETPDEGVPDSGWRFLAGDEDDDYMDNPENAGLYQLNTICNYDRDIIPYLNAPYNTAFTRGEDGKFHECEFTPPEI
mgnify:CR=1 FL=1